MLMSERSDGRGEEMERAADASAASATEDDARIFITRVGLRMPTGLAFEAWERAGGRLTEVMNSSAWCVGDWVDHGEQRFALRYRSVIDKVGLEYQTVRNYAWVARRFRLDRRRETLSFQHHAEVASLPETQQDLWLDRAVERGWSRNELRRNLRAIRGGHSAQRKTLPLPRIATEEERLDRWRAAAEQATGSLERWIVECLDNAAAAVLDTAAPSVEGR